MALSTLTKVAALQSLGCVPRDPSPEVQTTEDSEPTDAKPTQTTSEVPDAPISSEEEAELERLRVSSTPEARKTWGAIAYLDTGPAYVSRRQAYFDQCGFAGKSAYQAREV